MCDRSASKTLAERCGNLMNALNGFVGSRVEGEGVPPGPSTGDGNLPEDLLSALC